MSRERLVIVIVSALAAIPGFVYLAVGHGTPPAAEEEARTWQAAPAPTPVLDAASQAAVDRLVPHGDGTPWCLIERACPAADDGRVVYAFAIYVGTQHRRLCMDLAPCRELNLFPAYAPTGVERAP